MTIYAVSLHSGGGSMSEGFDSRGAIGFWDTEAEAVAVARELYREVARIDPSYFGADWDARVVPIEQVDVLVPISEQIKPLVDKIRSVYA